MKKPGGQSDERGKPHDALVQKTFSQPALAAGELQAILPPEIVRQIQWKTLTVVPGSWVNHRLRRRYTDLLFKVELRASRTALIYVLFEHQSTVKPLMALRLLQYMCNVWEHWCARNPKARRIPAIVPVVLHHGSTRWTPARDFLSLIDLPPESLEHWRRFLPSFEYQVDDLPVEPDEVLRARPMSAAAKLVVLALKHARKGRGVLDRLPEWRVLFAGLGLEPGGREVLFSVVEYLLQVTQVEPEEVGEHLGEDPAVQEAIMMTAGERLIEQGRKEGERKGRLEGQRGLLIEQFRARFGSVSRRTMMRIKGASAEQLALWGKRLVTAPSSEAVFMD